MTQRLAESQRLLGESRQRLAGLAARVQGLRERLSPTTAPAPSRSPTAPAGLDRPLPFGGADARPIDDIELKFEAVVEDAPQK
jgi:hypothetical protein